jgi:tripartite-type tricarboxylate transporter receptor subunit TctC
MTMGLGSIPSIMPPSETKAFVKKQYETFKEIAEKVGLSVN